MPLILQGHVPVLGLASRPAHGLPPGKQAMIVRMSPESIDALQAALASAPPNQSPLQFQIGPNAGIHIGSQVFPMSVQQESDRSIHELYVRTQANPPSTTTPLQMIANVTGKMTVTRELDTGIRDKVRQSSVNAEKDRTGRKAILLSEPLPTKQLANGKKRKPPAGSAPIPLARQALLNKDRRSTPNPPSGTASPAPPATKVATPPKPPVKVTTRAVPKVTPTPPSPPETIASLDLKWPSNALNASLPLRIIHELAHMDQSVEEMMMSLHIRQPKQDAPEIKRILNIVGHPNRPTPYKYRLKNEVFQYLRPLEWTRYTPKERDVVLHKATVALKSLGISENAPEYLRFVKPPGYVDPPKIDDSLRVSKDSSGSNASSPAVAGPSPREKLPDEADHAKPPPPRTFNAAEVAANPAKVLKAEGFRGGTIKKAAQSSKKPSTTAAPKPKLSKEEKAANAKVKAEKKKTSEVVKKVLAPKKEPSPMPPARSPLPPAPTATPEKAPSAAPIARPIAPKKESGGSAASGTRPVAKNSNDIKGKRVSREREELPNGTGVKRKREADDAHPPKPNGAEKRPLPHASTSAPPKKKAPPRDYDDFGDDILASLAAAKVETKSVPPPSKPKKLRHRDYTDSEDEGEPNPLPKKVKVVERTVSVKKEEKPEKTLAAPKPPRPSHSSTPSVSTPSTSIPSTSRPRPQTLARSLPPRKPAPPIPKDYDAITARYKEVWTQSVEIYGLMQREFRLNNEILNGGDDEDVELGDPAYLMELRQRYDEMQKEMQTLRNAALPNS